MKLTLNNNESESGDKGKENSDGEEASEEAKHQPSLLEALGDPADSMRSMALYGDIHEEKASDIVGGLLALQHMSKKMEDEEDKAIEMYKTSAAIDLNNTNALIEIEYLNEDLGIERIDNIKDVLFQPNHLLGAIPLDPDDYPRAKYPLYYG